MILKILQLAVLGVMVAQSEALIEAAPVRISPAAVETGPASLTLPDALVTQSGQTVRSADAWIAVRRNEILELFRENVYGRTPVGRPTNLVFTVDSLSDAMDGRATCKRVTISYGSGRGQGTIHLTLFVPRGPERSPCFLLICNRGARFADPAREVKSSFWPAEEIVSRGYAAAVFLNTDVAPDRYNGFTNGVYSIFDNPAGRTNDSWGAVAAWAWGASRVMDYLATDKDIDFSRVAVVGHSRGGKAALWAGAEDERFGLVISNDSGCSGAALARGKSGENIREINRVFPHWFCQNYKRYDDRESELPVDQHMLAALIAPRLLYIASATEDATSDPGSEFLTAVNAGPVFQLLGVTGLESPVLPPPDMPLSKGHIGYHLRTGKHDLTEYDWNRFMDFADTHWKAKAPSR